jgi:hypothetical protein
MKSYFNRRNKLAIEQGMLLWGHRLVIPIYGKMFVVIIDAHSKWAHV